ncbi:MAG TPA: metal ABC transporter substrate-binding protein [Actinomycetota bacterium]
MRKTVLLGCTAILVAASGCTSEPEGHALRPPRFVVVTTVSPITDIARNVAGEGAEVAGIVPEGVDSHTFEPTTATVRQIAEADLIFVNGLELEEPTVDLARTNAPDATPIVALGDEAIDPSDHLYDFSFPRSGGKPNPHLWMSVPFAIDYAKLIAEQLIEVGPSGGDGFESRADAYVSELERLDQAIRSTVQTIPPENRVLLTYHDSFAYFAKEYGFRVLGAIQPGDFAEPSARDVARLVDQIRATSVPAIFGSEVFPSPVLEQIARETGVRFEASLRDDDLPGDAGDPEHSYIGLMIFDVSAMAEALGGDPSTLEKLEADGIGS